MKELVSVIVPVYNSEKWLKKCVNSIILQDYKDLEIILVDDGSTDNSGKICDFFSKKDKRIRVIHKENGGVSSARNYGINKSSGVYIKFVDSDDTLEKNCLKLLVNEIKKENVDLVICGLNIYKGGKLLRTPHLDNKIFSIRDSIDNFKYISKVFASPCNKLYKRSVISDSFDESLIAGEDLKFNISYLKNCNLVNCFDKCLYNVSLDNDESLNRKFKENKLDISLILIQDQINFCNVIYGLDNYDDTFIKNSTILNVHSYYREIVKRMGYNYFKDKFNYYKNNSIIRWALKGCKYERFDYKLFSMFVKYNMCICVYVLLKLKIFISKK